MQDYKSTVEEYIKKSILSKTGEAFFNFSLEEDDIYHELDCIGRLLSRKYVKGNSSFYLIESIRVQAAAVHGHQTILVFRGMLELIFRTSSMMVGAERSQNGPNEKFYEPWRNNLSSWLNNGMFEWSNEEYWWLRDQKYRKVFDMYVEAMFIFLVLHEIGHFHNLHGNRRSENVKDKSSSLVHNIFIHEAVGGEEKDEADKLAAHAREIIADTYAFQFMLTELMEHFFPESEYIDTDEEALKIINFSMCIYIVASLLWALNFQRPMSNDTQKDGYPSHAFRLRSIEVASLEHQVCGRGKQQTNLALKLGIQNYIKKLMCAAGNNEFVSWLFTMKIPENQEHYQKICEITEEWSNFEFGVRDEDLPRSYFKAFREFMK